MQNISYFLKGFTSVCLRISTRYKTIIKNNYLDSLLGEFKKKHAGLKGL